MTINVTSSLDSKVTSSLGSKVTSSLGSKGLKPLVMTTGSAVLTQRIKAVAILKMSVDRPILRKVMKAFY